MGFVYRFWWILKSLWIILSEIINILRKKRKKIFEIPLRIYHRFMFIAPCSDGSLLNLNVPFKLILQIFRLFSDVWSENTALFERLMKIHSIPPILYYGFKKWSLSSKCYSIHFLSQSGILNTMRAMREMDVEPSTDTYTKYVFPAIGDSMEDIKAALDVGSTTALPLINSITQCPAQFQPSCSG